MSNRYNNTPLVGNDTVTLSRDIYIQLLDERRKTFWVEIPDEVYNLVVSAYLDDIIAAYGDADPMVIIDNLAVNTEYCTCDNWGDNYDRYTSFEDFCTAKAIAYNDRVAILHW